MRSQSPKLVWLQFETRGTLVGKERGRGTCASAPGARLVQYGRQPFPVTPAAPLPCPSLPPGAAAPSFRADGETEARGGSSDPGPGKFGGCTWGAWGCLVVRGGRRGGGCWGAEQEPRDPPHHCTGLLCIWLSLLGAHVCAHACGCVHMCVCACTRVWVRARVGGCVHVCVCKRACAHGSCARTPGCACTCCCGGRAHACELHPGSSACVLVHAVHAHRCPSTACEWLPCQGGCTRIRASVRVHTRVPSWERICVSAWLEA